MKFRTQQKQIRHDIHYMSTVCHYQTRQNFDMAFPKHFFFENPKKLILIKSHMQEVCRVIEKNTYKQII